MSWGIYEVPLGQKEGTTFYTRHPDLFGKAYVLFSCILFVLLSFVEVEKRREDKEFRLLVSLYGHLFEEEDDRYEC